MALSEYELKKIEKSGNKFLEKKRPPEHIRDKVDLTYRIYGQSVEIIEIRANWKNPSEKNETSIAKTTYIKKTGVWKVYCLLCDMKWHSYKPVPEVR